MNQLIEKYQQELYDLEARAEELNYLIENTTDKVEAIKPSLEMSEILGQMQAYSAVLVDLRGMG